MTKIKYKTMTNKNQTNMEDFEKKKVKTLVCTKHNLIVFNQCPYCEEENGKD